VLGRSRRRQFDVVHVNPALARLTPAYRCEVMASGLALRGARGTVT
jgi:hypothetical protein